MGTAFAYAGELSLEWQATIMFVLGTVGTATFTKIDISLRKQDRKTSLNHSKDESSSSNTSVSITD